MWDLFFLPHRPALFRRQRESTRPIASGSHTAASRLPTHPCQPFWPSGSHSTSFLLLPPSSRSLSPFPWPAERQVAEREGGGAGEDQWGRGARGRWPWRSPCFLPAPTSLPSRRRRPSGSKVRVTTLCLSLLGCVRFHLASDQMSTFLSVSTTRAARFL
jgi:hypothetical protein